MSALPKPSERYTYADYRRWPDTVRGELMGGVFHSMSPAPALRHQRIALRVGSQLHVQLRGARCEALVAPVDVLLPGGEGSDDEIDDIVQPDVLVVCDPAKLGNGQNLRGAPDFVLEVLAPSTSRKDQIDKLALYERAGVREFWLLNPDDRVLTVYTRVSSEPGARYGRPRVIVAEGRLALSILPEVAIEFDEVFGDSVSG